MFKQIHLIIDNGAPIDIRTPRFELFSEQRTVQLPTDNILGVPPQTITVTAYGWNALIRNLRPGPHTIVQDALLGTAITRRSRTPSASSDTETPAKEMGTADPLKRFSSRVGGEGRVDVPVQIDSDADAIRRGDCMTLSAAALRIERKELRHA